MKKKNIVKKLLSVILSAATMFSLLTLPAHAIIPGEDAYGGDAFENGYIYLNLRTKEKTYVPKSSIPRFTGNSSYDALPTNVKTQMINNSINIEELLHQHTNYTTQGVDEGTFWFVNPTQYLYSGVVLVAIFDGNQFTYNFGTGFMLNNDTFISSLHLLYDYDDEDNTDILVTPDIPNIRVYFDVNIDRIINGFNPITEKLDDGSWEAIKIYLENHHTNYIEVEYIAYSDAVLASTHTGIHSDADYDWFLGKLETPVTDDIFYWDCEIPTISMEGSVRSYTIGYPIEYSLQMVETTGIIRVVYNNYNCIETYSRTNHGMSGGPIYAITNGVKCYGIHTFTATTETGEKCQSGVKIYSDLLSAIADFMNQ